MHFSVLLLDCFDVVLCRWKAAAAAAKSLQLCPTLWDPIDGSPPGSPVPEILQARTLEWVAIAFSEMEVSSFQNVGEVMSEEKGNV